MSKVDVEETEKGFVFSWILAVMDNTICGVLCRGKFFFFATQTMFGNEFRCMRKNKSFQSLGTQHVRCVIKAYFLLHSSVKKGSELPQYWKVILITINWFSIIFTQKASAYHESTKIPQLLLFQEVSLQRPQPTGKKSAKLNRTAFFGFCQNANFNIIFAVCCKPDHVKPQMLQRNCHFKLQLPVLLSTFH